MPATGTRKRLSPISEAEKERRRTMVWHAVRMNAIENARHSEDIEPIIQAFIEGEIEAVDIVPRIKALRSAGTR